MRRKEEIALAYPGRWIIHTDADELRRSPFEAHDLADGLAIAEANGATRVNFNIINFRPVEDSAPQQGTLAGRFCYFEFGDRPGHFQQAKAWLQGDVRVDLAMSGGHTASFPGASDFRYKFLLKHYPIRSREHGRRKVLQDRQARWSPQERAMGWHVQYDQYNADSAFLWDAGKLRRFDEDFWADHGLALMTDVIQRRLSGQ